jgi:hypothetical protein
MIRFFGQRALIICLYVLKLPAHAKLPQFLPQQKDPTISLYLCIYSRAAVLVATVTTQYWPQSCRGLDSRWPGDCPNWWLQLWALCSTEGLQEQVKSRKQNIP